MHIEDLIILLSIRVNMNPYDSKIISSFHNQISIGSGFTEKQANLALKILNRQKSKIESVLSKDISPFLENPTFRLAKRSVNSSKILNIVSHKIFGKVIHAKFPYDESIVNLIRQNKTGATHRQWDGEEKAWVFSLDERNLMLLMEINETYGFQLDQEINDYFDQIKSVKENFENFVPMIGFRNEEFCFLNCDQKIPKISTKNPVEALFIGRKYGIQTWEDQVEQQLKDSKCEKVVLDFLNSAPNENFEFYLENNSIFSLENIIKYLTPCIFVIPGGSEIEKIQTSLKILKNLNVDNSQISVMFRLPNETNADFNQFVKNSGLNNPISENTKAIFISSKVPKTIIEPKVKFNSVINFNFYNVHYTIREFLKNHHNVVTIFDKKPQRNINFANM